MRHLYVLALLLLTACPDDDPDPDETGEVSGTLTPYRGASAASAAGPASALVGLAREAARARQDAPALPLDVELPLRQPAPLARQPAGPRAVPGELLVGLVPGPAAQAARASPNQRARAALTRVATALPGLEVEHGSFLGRDAHRLRLRRAGGGVPTEEETEAALQRLRRQPGVRYAERNLRLHRLAEPNDEHYPLQWHYPLMNLPAAWDLQSDAEGVVVAVLDTGIRPHPDLDPRRLPGYDFISDPNKAGDGDALDADPLDQGGDLPNGDSSWHGSHVAGTVGAASNNGEGVSGVAWNLRLLPVRVLGRLGGDTADIIAAVRWAAGLDVPGVPRNENPARVVNLSLGGAGEPSQAFQEAIDELLTNPLVPGGTVVVVGAGNDNVDAAAFTPCNQTGVICVGAVGFSGARASYSNFGATVAVMAPGGEMREDLDGDRRPDGILSASYREDGTPVYSFQQGTSMSTPHVSGLVALMAAARGSDDPLTPAQAEEILRATATPGTQCTEGCGAGLVNALAAVARAAGTPPTGPARLSVTATTLGFAQGGRSSQALGVNNVGGGTLTATATAGGPEAARISFPAGNSVTVGPGETQQLTVAVDLAGLPAGTSQASVQLEAGEEAGSATLDVTLRAGDFPDRDALVVFVFPDEQGELDATDDTATVARAAEGYRYSLRLAPNTYFAIAGIDDDRDGVYFEQGERVGFWRNQDNPVEIVLAAGQTVSGIDFDLIPEVTLAATPPASQARPIPLR